MDLFIEKPATIAKLRHAIVHLEAIRKSQQRSLPNDKIGAQAGCDQIEKEHSHSYPCESDCKHIHSDSL